MTFEQWWIGRGGTMRGSRYLAKAAWDAAQADRAEIVKRLDEANAEIDAAQDVITSCEGEIKRLKARIKKHIVEAGKIYRTKWFSGKDYKAIDFTRNLSEEKIPE